MKETGGTRRATSEEYSDRVRRTGGRRPRQRRPPSVLEASLRRAWRSPGHNRARQAQIVDLAPCALGLAGLAPSAGSSGPGAPARSATVEQANLRRAWGAFGSLSEANLPLGSGGCTQPRGP